MGLEYLFLAFWGGLAGLIYGFAGFGAALIFMPVAAALIGPVAAVAVMAIMALGSIFTVLPRAWPQADLRASGIMLGAAVLALPFGVLALRSTDPDLLRWAVSGIVLVTLVAMLAGFRLRRTPGVPAWLAVGAGVGFLGGSTGLNGPVLVLFQLSGSDSAERSRANTIVVLTLSGLALLPVMALQGVLAREAVLAGLALVPIYALGGWIGRRLFDPGRAGLYRSVAYVIVGAAAILGLPVWG